MSFNSRRKSTTTNLDNDFKENESIRKGRSQSLGGALNKRPSPVEDEDDLTPSKKARRVAKPRRSILKPQPPPDSDDEDEDNNNDNNEGNKLKPARKSEGASRRVSFASHCYIRLFEGEDDDAKKYASPRKSPSPKKKSNNTPSPYQSSPRRSPRRTSSQFASPLSQQNQQPSSPTPSNTTDISNNSDMSIVSQDVTSAFKNFDVKKKPLDGSDTEEDEDTHESINNNGDDQTQEMDLTEALGKIVPNQTSRNENVNDENNGDGDQNENGNDQNQVELPKFTLSPTASENEEQSSSDNENDEQDTTMDFTVSMQQNGLAKMPQFETGRRRSSMERRSSVIRQNELMENDNNNTMAMDLESSSSDEDEQSVNINNSIQNNEIQQDQQQQKLHSFNQIDNSDSSSDENMEMNDQTQTMDITKGLTVNIDFGQQDRSTVDEQLQPEQPEQSEPQHTHLKSQIEIDEQDQSQDMDQSMSMELTQAVGGFSSQVPPTIPEENSSESDSDSGDYDNGNNEATMTMEMTKPIGKGILINEETRKIRQSAPRTSRVSFAPTLVEKSPEVPFKPANNNVNKRSSFSFTAPTQSSLMKNKKNVRHSVGGVQFQQSSPKKSPLKSALKSPSKTLRASPKKSPKRSLSIISDVFSEHPSKEEDNVINNDKPEEDLKQSEVQQQPQKLQGQQEQQNIQQVQKNLQNSTLTSSLKNKQLTNMLSPHKRSSLSGSTSSPMSPIVKRLSLASPMRIHDTTPKEKVPARRRSSLALSAAAQEVTVENQKDKNQENETENKNEAEPMKIDEKKVDDEQSQQQEKPQPPTPSRMRRSLTPQQLTPRRQSLRLAKNVTTPQKEAFSEQSIGKPIPSPAVRKEFAADDETEKVLEGILQEEKGNNDENDDNDLREAPVQITLGDFLEMTDMKFLDGISTIKRRSTVGGTNLGSSKKAVKDPELLDYVMAHAVTGPKLEMMYWCCHELKRYISEGEEALNSYEREVEHENPPVIVDYLLASDDMRARIEAQLKIVKNNSRLDAKRVWYGWRRQLVTGHNETLNESFENLEKDKERLKHSRKNLGEQLPQLRDLRDKLKFELNREKDIVKDLANCDRDEVAGLREAISEQSQPLESYKAEIASNNEELSRLRSRVAEKNEHLRITKEVIENNRNDWDMVRGLTKAEAMRRKGEYESLQVLHNWKITHIGDNDRIFEYCDELKVEIKDKKISLTLLNKKKYQLLPLKEYLVELMIRQIDLENLHNESLPMILQKISMMWFIIQKIHDEYKSIELNYKLKFIQSDEGSLITEVPVIFRQSKSKIKVNLIVGKDLLVNYPLSIKSLKVEVINEIGNLDTESINNTITQNLTSFKSNSNILEQALESIHL